MKMLVASDFHGDAEMLGVKRYPEVEEAIVQSVNVAIQEEVDTYLFLGDLTDPDTGGYVFRTISLMVKMVRRLVSNQIRFVAIAGNHDVVQDGSGDTTITPLAPLESSGLVHIFERPGSTLIGKIQEKIMLLALPYTAPSHAYDPSTIWERDLSTIDDETKVIVAGHLMLPGIHPGSETTDMPRGREVIYPFESTKNAHMRFCGHYHQRQTFDPGDGGPEIIVPGSLARLTFGEEKHDPGFLIVEV